MATSFLSPGPPAMEGAVRDGLQNDLTTASGRGVSGGACRLAVCAYNHGNNLPNVNVPASPSHPDVLRIRR